MKFKNVKSNQRRRLLLVDSRTSNLMTHRMPIVQAAVMCGYEVHVTTLVEDVTKGIDTLPVQYHPCGPKKRQGGFRELDLVKRLWKIVKTVAPEICHFVSVRSVVYGLLISKTLGCKGTVSTITGLGYLFIAESWLIQLQRRIVGLLIRWGTNSKGNVLVFQNGDDLRLFESRSWLPAQGGVIVNGSGVDIERFAATPVPLGSLTVLFPSRYLIHKGIQEFVQAAKIVKRGSPNVVFALAGGVDANNPASISTNVIDEAVRGGVVEDLGYQEDMVVCMQRATIVCLPSYREGLPKALLEAAAIGRPLVATDVPGCREIVVNDWNGKLVPPRDAWALARCIQGLLREPNNLHEFGRNSRKLVEDKFTETTVASQYKSIYKGVQSDIYGEEVA